MIVINILKNCSLLLLCSTLLMGHSIASDVDQVTGGMKKILYTPYAEHLNVQRTFFYNEGEAVYLSNKGAVLIQGDTSLTTETVYDGVFSGPFRPCVEISMFDPVTQNLGAYHFSWGESLKPIEVIKKHFDDDPLQGSSDLKIELYTVMVDQRDWSYNWPGYTTSSKSDSGTGLHDNQEVKMSQKEAMRILKREVIDMLKVPQENVTARIFTSAINIDDQSKIIERLGKFRDALLARGHHRTDFTSFTFSPGSYVPTEFSKDDPKAPDFMKLLQYSEKLGNCQNIE